jgi:excisionase family DNA binding protein
MITHHVAVSDRVTPLRAGEVLGVSRSYIYQLIASDALAVERLGPRTILVTRESLVRFLRSRGAHVESSGDELVITDVKVPLDKEKIRDFCTRWHITEFALFGSVVRDDFRPDSDIDILVSFAPDAAISLISYMQMMRELEALFGRTVDLVTRRSIEESRNPMRRQEILSTAEVIYATAA